MTVCMPFYLRTLAPDRDEICHGGNHSYQNAHNRYCDRCDDSGRLLLANACETAAPR